MYYKSAVTRPVCQMIIEMIRFTFLDILEFGTKISIFDRIGLFRSLLQMYWYPALLVTVVWSVIAEPDDHHVHHHRWTDGRGHHPGPHPHHHLIHGGDPQVLL